MKLNSFIASALSVSYKRMKSRIELLEILAEAEDDKKNGRVEPIENTFRDLRQMLKEK